MRLPYLKILDNIFVTLLHATYVLPYSSCKAKSVETSEQVVPCIPSPTMKTISPECTPGKSTGMVSSHGRYLTGMAGSRQCLQQRRLRMSKRLLKSQIVTYSQNQTETNKQIRLFTGDDIFA